MFLQRKTRNSSIHGNPTTGNSHTHIFYSPRTSPPLHIFFCDNYYFFYAIKYICTYILSQCDAIVCGLTGRPRPLVASVCLLFHRCHFRDFLAKSRDLLHWLSTNPETFSHMEIDVSSRTFLLLLSLLGGGCCRELLPGFKAPTGGQALSSLPQQLHRMRKLSFNMKIRGGLSHVTPGDKRRPKLLDQKITIQIKEEPF